VRIGIDFDNTIVCYDAVFHQVARERSLVPPSVPISKQAVRDYLRATGREDVWTEMQGYVYGPRLREAQAYPGALEFIRRAGHAGHETFIVSHKTRQPYAGEAYDLHAAALSWIVQQGLDREQVFLELTKHDKLRRIDALECDYFIDDLPELLSEPDFPARVGRVLFDPADVHASAAGVIRARSWLEIERKLLAA
jgi:hypothetical protein